MSGSAESGGDDSMGDGRKGGKRELSQSKRAAQNRAAQVRPLLCSYVFATFLRRGLVWMSTILVRQVCFALSILMSSILRTQGLRNYCNDYSVLSDNAKKDTSRNSRSRSESCMPWRITTRPSRRRTIRCANTSFISNRASSSRMASFLNHPQTSTSAIHAKIP